MKPCTSLEQEEYLKLAIAEQDGLITINFETSEQSQPFSDMLGSSSKSKTTSAKSTDEDGATVTASSTSQSTSNPAPNTFHRTIADKLKSFYQKDEFSYNVEQWNLQRAQVIDEMCTKFLFPDFEKELRSKLLHEAKQYVFKQSALKLKSILSIAPYEADLQTFDGVDDAASNKGTKSLTNKQ